MNWKLKSLFQWIVPNLPGGDFVFYYLQKNVIKSIPRDFDFNHLLSIALQHIEGCKKFLNKPLSNLIFFEFGAGKDLVFPLFLYSFGVTKQYLVDVKFLINQELINYTIANLKKHENELFVRKVDEFISNDIVADLQKIYNINYKAPVDTYSNIEDESIDCVTSTATLEHVSEKDIYNILNETSRIIKKDGVISFMIDYVDHYSYSDKSLPLFNFYKYSEKSWKKYNPRSHYQNRIRHNDYLKIFSKSGFVVLDEIKIMCSEKDVNEIKKMKIDKQFENHSITDLSVKSAFIFLRKKS